MSKWKPALALILVFIAGFVFGVAATKFVVRRVVREMLTDQQKARNQVAQQTMMQLAGPLGLSVRQRQEVRQIVRQGLEQMRGVRQGIQPRLLEISSNTVSQIEAVLSPEQAHRFEKIPEKTRLLMPGRSIPPGL